VKVLVTGGSGFIGSHVVEHYHQNAEVVVLDNFRSGNAANLKGLNCTLVEGSIADRSVLDHVMAGVDVVIHLAALVSVPESVVSPRETVDLNVMGLLNVLESARGHGVRKLCLASSAAVYGERPEQPKREDMVPDPRSPYAITKLDGEYYCALYAREGWLPTACLRFFNVFGPRQNPRSAYAAAVAVFLQCAREGRPVVIHGDGGQTRDFVYVKDVVSALAFAAESPRVTGVFNVGYGAALSILDLAREIVRLTGSRSEIVFEPPRAGDIRHSTADPSRLMAAGWKPSHSVSGGLSELIGS